jgi:HEAT repeat protein
MACLVAAVQYEANPAVRVAAAEALQSVDSDAARAWVRSALSDDHPAVRYAACLAVGVTRDALGAESARRCLTDHDPSVRVGALFALHRLGDPSETGRLADYLLDHEDATVRRNAALVLGMMGEPGAVKMLARAMRDGDAGVRQHALEAMARLGNREAAKELTFMANAGVGSDEVIAVQALTTTGDRAYADALRYKLSTAIHLETRLAAAAGLGALGIDDGYETAIRALNRATVRLVDANDPPAMQRLRTQQLAATALGAIGRADALPALADLLDHSPDPRLQVAAARAILMILQRGATDYGQTDAVAQWPNG